MTAPERNPTTVECAHVEPLCGRQAFWAGVVTGVMAGLCLAAVAKWLVTS